MISSNMVNGQEKREKVDNAHLSVVILPDPASNLMTAQIKSLELDFANA